MVYTKNINLLILTILFLIPILSIAQENKTNYNNLSEALKNFKAVKKITIKYPIANDSLALISRLTALHYLEISNQKELSINFSEFKQLEKLILQNNNLDSFPVSIMNLKNIDSLILYDNYIKEIPDWISNFQKLQTLGLVGNKIKYFPSQFFLMNKIKFLYAGYNAISFFDIRLLQLPNITVIDLAGNIINQLPQRVAISKSLKTINLSNNELTWEKINQFKKDIPKNIWLIHSESKTPIFNGSISECNNKDTSSETIFTKCETCPQFEGGEMKFKKFLNLHFNKALLSPDIKHADSVTLKFVVFKKGGISSVTVIQANNNSIATEASRLINESCPYWIPANFSGRLVNSWITLKLYFKPTTREIDNSKSVEAKIIPN